MPELKESCNCILEAGEQVIASCEKMQGIINGNDDNDIIYLDSEYLQALNDLCVKDYKVVIIGQDPFPEDAIGIPFCKVNKGDIDKKKIVGMIEYLASRYTEQKFDSNGRELFIELAEKGIIFLNALYFEQKKLYRHKAEIKANSDESQKKENLIKFNKEIQDLQESCYEFNKIFLGAVEPSKIYCFGQKAESLVARYLTVCFEHPSSRGNTLNITGLKHFDDYFK